MTVLDEAMWFCLNMDIPWYSPLSSGFYNVFSQLNWKRTQCWAILEAADSKVACLVTFDNFAGAPGQRTRGKNLPQRFRKREKGAMPLCVLSHGGFSQVY